jgi:hypothetical protein
MSLGNSLTEIKPLTKRQRNKFGVDGNIMLGDRQCPYSVTLMCVGVTIADVGKQ